jgi:hypothetical protein
MYQVQFKSKHRDSKWDNDKAFAGLKEALAYTCDEACDVNYVSHRIVTIDRNGKSKIIAKFKPMGLLV